MKKKNLMKSLTALVLSVLMVLSLAACGAKPSDGGKDEDKDGYTVAIIKQMDHASLDEIADAIAARLDAIAQEQNVSIRYTITSGQGDQSVLKQLADQVSFVTQDNFLFNCPLKENIRLGNPNATDEEVYAAAKAACCDDFIVRLEKGYDTPAGDAGKRLSGGEKQRIAIARAILKNAPIVILDEATAFTDPQNEDKIQKSIMALSKGKTLLVIAHRLSTIQNADQIVVLKKGQIVDCGKQEELLERCPLYADMWQAHIGAKNWSVGEKKEVAVNV